MRLFAIGLLLAAFAFAPSAVTGQGLHVGPRVALGGGSAMTAQVAIRADVLWQRWGWYTAIGVRAATSTCALSASGSCTLPSPPAWELVAGVTAAAPGTPLYFSVGGGAIRWGGGTDPLLEGEIGLRFPVSASLKLGIGVHALFAPGLERPNVSSVDVHFVEGVVGLSIGVGWP